MHVIKALFVISILIQFFNGNANPVSRADGSEDYHWRDYKNAIPKDAFLAVNDGKGTSMYIAQVLHDEVLIPGVILYPEPNGATFQYLNEVQKAVTNIKIFCTDNPSGLKWVKTNTSDFLIDENYIVGGYESKHEVFIGRSSYEGNPILGKIIVLKSDPVYLRSIHAGKPVLVEDFEVLSLARPYRAVTTKGTTESWLTPTEGWFQKLKTSLPPFHVDSKENFAVSRSAKSLTITNDEKCTCSKGTVIINFN